MAKKHKPKEPSKITGLCVCGSTRFEFNLNNHVRFKPTELGKIAYKAYWLPYSAGGHVRDLGIDEEGWAEMQVHEFMSIYGKYFQAGMNGPCETTVVFINRLTEQIQVLKENDGTK